MRIRRYLIISVISFVLAFVLWKMLFSSSVVPKLAVRGVQFKRLDSGKVWAASLIGEQFGDEEIDLLRHVRTLEEINLRGSQITDQGVDLLADMPNLKVLQLSETGITDASLRTLARAKQLKILFVEGCENLTPAGLVALKDCGQLHSYFQNYKPKDYDELVELESRYPSVKFLVTANTLFGLTATDAVHAKWYPEESRTVAVEARSGVGSPLSVAEFKEIPGQRIVQLRFDTRDVLDPAMLERLKSFKNLKSLIINCHVTVNLIEAIGELSQLETLFLTHQGGSDPDSKIIQIGETGLSPLTKLSHLHTLSLSLPVDDPSAFSVLQSLKQLQRLRVYQANLNDEDVSFLITLKELESLDLYGNRLTDASCGLLNELESLTSLDIRGNQFTTDALNQMMRVVIARRER